MKTCLEFTDSAFLEYERESLHNLFILLLVIVVFTSLYLFSSLSSLTHNNTIKNRSNLSVTYLVKCFQTVLDFSANSL